MLEKYKDKFSVYLKGIGMGVADVIPGVSGGTVALITGIYERLINALNEIDLAAFKLLFTFQLKKLFFKLNGPFLLAIMLGVFTAVLTFAKLIKFLLENYPILLWGFFFGLIAASAWVVGKKIKSWSFNKFALTILGTAIAYGITNSGIIETEDSLLNIFFAGVLSIIAMVLPGISGSFILVILDKYHTIIAAVSSVSDLIKSSIQLLLGGSRVAFDAAIADFQGMVILVFYAGTLSGIIGFSKVLHWLFNRFYDGTLAVLTGFLIGSLPKIWPWKETLTYYEDRKGNLKPLVEENVMPTTFELEVWLAFGLGIGGFLLVYFLELQSDKLAQKK